MPTNTSTLTKFNKRKGVTSMSNLPKFKYHPNVYDDSIITHGEGVCQCCGNKVNVYTEFIYSRHDDIRCICMNCIADGSAAKKFDGEFIQDVEQRVSDPTKTDELLHRTPGYSSWQGEYWLTCCDDYCEFLGSVGGKELDELGIPDNVIKEYADEWKTELDRYELEKYGSPSGYLFRCLHCGKYRLNVDFD
jgi:uncharacterized protein CbrC (UPF0167 family)